MAATTEGEVHPKCNVSGFPIRLLHLEEKQVFPPSHFQLHKLK